MLEEVWGSGLSVWPHPHTGGPIFLQRLLLRVHTVQGFPTDCSMCPTTLFESDQAIWHMLLGPIANCWVRSEGTDSYLVPPQYVVQACW